MHCLNNSIGTAIACVDDKGVIHTSPMGKTMRMASVYVISSNQEKENTRTLCLE